MNHPIDADSIATRMAMKEGVLFGYGEVEWLSGAAQSRSLNLPSGPKVRFRVRMVVCQINSGLFYIVNSSSVVDIWWS